MTSQCFFSFKMLSCAASTYKQYSPREEASKNLAEAWVGK